MADAADDLAQLMAVALPVPALEDQDQETAEAYADQFVRYMINLMFEVRALTQTIGEALVAEGVLSEDSWVGR